jgi:ABC-type amino acid transport substrate-binding protein
MGRCQILTGVALVGWMLAAGPVSGAGPGGEASGLPSPLRVLVAADEMPEMFSFEQSGPPGFEREVVEGFCRMNSLKMEIVPVRDFDRIIPMLLRGEGDLITGIVDTAERREQIAFSEEMFPVRHLAVSRRPGLPVQEVSALRELRVGTIPGTSWEKAVVDAGVPRSRRHPYRDADALLAGLRGGEVDAVVMALLDYALAQKRDPDLVAGTFVGPTAPAAIGMRKGDTDLRRAFDTYLEGMRQARHHLMFKYLSEEALSLIALARRD